MVDNTIDRSLNLMANPNVEVNVTNRLEFLKYFGNNQCLEYYLNNFNTHLIQVLQF